MVPLIDPSPMNFTSFFSSNRRRSTSSSSTSPSTSGELTAPHTKNKPPAPRLTRNNAFRDIQYDPPDNAAVSVDLHPSFRINGNADVVVESLCRSLGLSGPEEFAVDLATWQARRPLPPARHEEPVEAAPPAEANGIRGARPPMIAPPMIEQPTVVTPPPPIRSYRPAVDGNSNTGTAWQLVSSFGPRVEAGVSMEDDGVAVSLVVNGGRDGTATMSTMASWSFTTQNDDDCSSTTTEGFGLSPNMIRPRFWEAGVWIKGKELGRGSFGTVYEGISEGGVFFAVKEVSLVNQLDDGRQSILQLEQEISLLSQFDHENIVRYLGTEKKDDKFYIFLELVTQGSLASLYLKYHLQDSQVSAYTRQILHGLQYLHERNVVHRDIKCANILVDANGSAKLADFGLAKQTNRFDVLKSCKGSIYWMAPEVVRPDSSYGSPADIWSLGCAVLEMLTRKPPYMLEQRPDEQNWVQTFLMIGAGTKPYIPDTISPVARDFIDQCIQVDPNHRQTAEQLLNHPFVKRQSPTFASPGSPYGRRLQ